MSNLHLVSPHCQCNCKNKLPDKMYFFLKKRRKINQQFCIMKGSEKKGTALSDSIVIGFIVNYHDTFDLAQYNPNEP